MDTATIIELHQSGMTPAEIADHYGSLESTIRTYLIGAGVDLSDDPARRSVHQKLVRLYHDEGLAIEDVADRVGLAPATIRIHLASAGRPACERPQPDPPRKWDPDHDEMQRLYVDQDLSIYEIGELVGVSHETVRKRLREAGFGPKR